MTASGLNVSGHCVLAHSSTNNFPCKETCSDLLELLIQPQVSEGCFGRLGKTCCVSETINCVSILDLALTACDGQGTSFRNIQQTSIHKFVTRHFGLRPTDYKGFFAGRGVYVLFCL